MFKKDKGSYDPERRDDFTEEEIDTLIDEILDSSGKPDPAKCRTLKDALKQIPDAAKDRRDKALKKCAKNK